MNRQFNVALLFFLIVNAFPSCNLQSLNRKAEIPPSPQPQELTQVPGSLFFRIKQVPNQIENESKIKKWLAVYEKSGKVVPLESRLVFSPRNCYVSGLGLNRATR